MLQQQHLWDWFHLSSRSANSPRAFWHCINNSRGRTSGAMPRPQAARPSHNENSGRRSFNPHPFWAVFVGGCWWWHWVYMGLPHKVEVCHDWNDGTTYGKGHGNFQPLGHHSHHWDGPRGPRRRIGQSWHHPCRWPEKCVVYGWSFQWILFLAFDPYKISEMLPEKVTKLRSRFKGWGL